MLHIHCKGSSRTTPPHPLRENDLCSNLFFNNNNRVFILISWGGREDSIEVVESIVYALILECFIIVSFAFCSF